MDSLFATITALVVSLAVLPVMMRLAPRLKLLDHPNGRKVHLYPIPRVGGWGITLGAVTAVLLWLPVGPTTVAFMLGAVILLLGGTADDRRELPASTKLLFQAAAAVPVVVYAGLVVHTLPLPLFGELHFPPVLAMALTGLGLLACINSTNTSDGLDGLAAGVTLLSLAGILYLAFMSENTELLIMTAATIGSLCGFLRYNTHPAIVFMGDSGSQYLGFAVGLLALALVLSDTVSFSPWTLLLLLGLPPADLAVVAVRRLMRGEHCFKADKTHFHHRVLNLGFTHSQSVILIYALQASFVFFAVVLRISEDWKIVLVYVLHLVLIYGFLSLAEHSQRSNGGSPIPLASRSGEPTTRIKPALVWAPRVALETLIPAILIICASLATTAPTEFGIVGAIALVPLLAWVVTRRPLPSIIIRAQAFMVAAAVVYLYTDNRPFVSAVSWLTEFAGFVAVGLLIFVTLKYSPMRRKEEFRVTAMDYLLVMVVILTLISLQSTTILFDPFFLLYLPIVLYGCEIILVERRERPNWLQLATWVTALILVVRGLLL